MSAGNKGSDFVPILTLAERGGNIDTFGTEHEDDSINNGRAFKHINRARESNAPGQGGPEFIATLHATAVSRGDNDNGCCILHNPLYYLGLDGGKEDGLLPL